MCIYIMVMMCSSRTEKLVLTSTLPHLFSLYPREFWWFVLTTFVLSGVLKQKSRMGAVLR